MPLWNLGAEKPRRLHEVDSQGQRICQGGGSCRSMTTIGAPSWGEQFGALQNAERRKGGEGSARPASPPLRPYALHFHPLPPTRVGFDYQTTIHGAREGDNGTWTSNIYSTGQRHNYQGYLRKSCSKAWIHLFWCYSQAG